MTIRDHDLKSDQSGWSPELETLDQLLCSDLPVAVVRGLYDDDGRFIRAVEAMLCEGEIRLLAVEGSEVPKWQWRSVLDSVTKQPDACGYRLSITNDGIRRIG